MVKRTSPKIKSEIDNINEAESSKSINQISQLLSNHYSKQFDAQLNDDLILSLSDKHENRRARQVFEWEKIRRQNAQRAV